jgi:DNA repair photolyase
VKSRESKNPPNRFHTQVVTYDEGEGPPPATITLIDDHSRSILSENDSPDVGFRWSVNPYRGCQHACAYCMSPDTPILLGDTRVRPIADLKIGDEIYGTRFDGKVRRFTRTHVLDKWSTRKPAFRVSLADGTELIASGDHRFLTARGWKHVVPAERPAQRPFLTTNNSLMGIGRVFADTFAETDAYRRGYLCGMIRGDATLARYDYSGRRRRGKDVLYQFRLALVDLEALARTRRYLAEASVEVQSFQFAAARTGYRELQAIRTSSRPSFDRINELVAFPPEPDADWSKGFLAGIFDAEGSRSKHVLRIANSDERIIDETVRAFARFGFDTIVEQQPRPVRPMYNVRLRGGLHEHLRMFHLACPAITRKWDLEDAAIKFAHDLRVVSIEPVGWRELVDITTGTGDFIANGVISHNCYARPTHEYLDMGAGTDFDTKIVVKREAPELLRAAFDKPSWKGELVMFSGVTDCYQPIEKELELTRRCLEVCLEYRNPVNVISKSALVERDVELFVALAREARFHLSVSLAFTDADTARAIEPWAPSPERRLKVIETMAKAGVPVGVMAAPIIPGVNDSQLVELLERAVGAGATWAGWVLLRLPGAVKQVFEERVRVALPLAGDKIMHRIRETRGGKLYDSTFHTRGRGEGVYAQTIGALFEATCARLGLTKRDREKDEEDDRTTTFRRPPKKTNQLSLF